VLFNLFLALSDKSATTLLPDAVVLMYSPLLAPTTPAAPAGTEATGSGE